MPGKRVRRDGVSVTPQELLRNIFLNTVIIPPLIAGLVLMGKIELDGGTWAVFGLFIFGGFIIWTLSIKMFSSPDMGNILGCTLLAITYAFAAMLTLLWATIFGWYMSNETGVIRNTLPQLVNFAVGVILIQIVYGDVYRNTWGANLSDRWPGERPNYIIFGIILGLFAAA